MKMSQFQEVDRRRIYLKKHAGRAFALALVLILSGIAVFGLRVNILNQPASVAIAAKPNDCVIELGKLSPKKGKLSAKDLKPGVYHLKISRLGFAPYSSDIRLERGQSLCRKFTLNPLPCAFKLATTPNSANYTIKLANGSVRTGKTSFQEEVSAGLMKISVTMDGYQPVIREIFLDQAKTLNLWMDPQGQILDCLSVFNCGPSPKGVAITPDKREVWVTHLCASPSVGVYHSLTGEKIKEIRLGNAGGVEVIFSKDGSKAYVSQMETAKVYEIDRATHQVLRTFDTKSSWSKVMELSPDGKTLYVSNWCGNDISEIDLNSGILRRRLATVKTPRGLYATQDGKWLYVAGIDKGELERINLADGTRKLLYSSGGSMRHIVANEKRGFLYASDLAKDCIWALDLKTEKVQQFARTDHKPNTIDLSADGKVLFASCRGANNPKSYYLPGPEWGSVIAFDTATGKMLDAIIGGNQCTALDVSDDGKLLAFSDFLDGRLHVYDIPPYEVLANGGGGRSAAHVNELRK